MMSGTKKIVLDSLHYWRTCGPKAFAKRLTQELSYRAHFGRIGKAVGVPQSRVDKALSMIDRQGLGLEIGPSYNPLAPKRQGFNVHVLDHASADELRAKYQGLCGANLEDIEDVDYVWHGEPLHELVGREHCYDWIIASHVIEHAPDLITFLQECERLLKSHGVLSLVIPDKRYCFDYFNPTTSTGELLDAFEQKRKRPSPGKVFDHFAGQARCNGQMAWGRGGTGKIELVGSLDEACAAWRKATTSTDYIDVHSWRFTPNSFRLMLTDIQMLNLTGLGLAKAFDTEGFEFFIALRKINDLENENRTLRKNLIQGTDGLTSLERPLAEEREDRKAKPKKIGARVKEIEDGPEKAKEELQAIVRRPALRGQRS
jgi:SAM-dependent methyltransferase